MICIIMYLYYVILMYINAYDAYDLNDVCDISYYIHNGHLIHFDVLSPWQGVQPLTLLTWIDWPCVWSMDLPK